MGHGVLLNQVVLGVLNRDTQDTLLKVRRLTLTQCIDICRISENAVEKSKVIRQEPVSKVRSEKEQGKGRQSKPSSADRKVLWKEA